MKYFLVAFFILFILLCIVNGILRIYLAILRLKNKRLNRQGAQLDYKLIKMYYNNLMSCRRVHYEANFYEDQIKKQKVQKECREKYEESVKKLETYEKETEFMQYLTETEQNEIKEVLASPRYELY